MLEFTYELVDPRDNLPFYIGRTNNPNLRMFEHLTKTGGNKEKSARIQEIVAAELQPIMNILEVTQNRNDSKRSEAYWIQKYLAQGIKLTNVHLMAKKTESSPEKQPRSKKKLHIQSKPKDHNKPVHQKREPKPKRPPSQKREPQPKLYKQESPSPLDVPEHDGNVLSVKEVLEQLGIGRDRLNYWVRVGYIKRAEEQRGYYQKASVDWVEEEIWKFLDAGKRETTS